MACFRCQLCISSVLLSNIFFLSTSLLTAYLLIQLSSIVSSDCYFLILFQYCVFKYEIWFAISGQYLVILPYQPNVYDYYFDKLILVAMHTLQIWYIPKRLRQLHFFSSVEQEICIQLHIYNRPFSVKPTRFLTWWREFLLYFGIFWSYPWLPKHYVFLCKNIAQNIQIFYAYLCRLLFFILTKIIIC